MELFRVFDWDGASADRRRGGPLYVARERQGSGRHDAPAMFGAWYCARTAISAIAESIQYLRGHVLQSDDFRRTGGLTKAIVALDLDDDAGIVDLDDPPQLVGRSIRPSQVATLRRTVTQAIAVMIFREGAVGLSWWSTLDAEWTNVTMFHERALRHISLASAPEALSLRMADVRLAAQHLGIEIGSTTE